jgi:trehalose synthase-fused probable maltokinase
VLAIVQVQYHHAEPVSYVLPLAVDGPSGGLASLGGSPSGGSGQPAPAAIARLVGAGEPMHLLDGSLVPGVFEGLLSLVRGRRQVRGGEGRLAGHRRPGLRGKLGRDGQALKANPLREQPFMSNSSASFADKVVLKLYRVLEEGPNPDLEVGTWLAQRGFRSVPDVLGSIEASRGPRSSATLAMVQAFVPNEGNLWQATREAVGSFLHDVAAEGAAPEPGVAGDLSFIELARREAPPDVRRLLGASMAMAATLGERVGEMHVALASGDPSDPAFGPEPLTQLHVRSMYQSIRRRVREASGLLAAQEASLDGPAAAAARRALEAVPQVEALLARLRVLRIDGQRIRVHGDLHLGHVLDTGSDVAFLDFEGDSSRPLSERRLKRPALTDLASLVRSLHFAAHWPGVERELLGGDGAASDGLAAWSTFWFRWTSAACIGGYRSVTEGAPFQPGDDMAWSVLFRSLLVSRACDELTSRQGSRSDWLGLPLAGLDELLGGSDEGAA